jgi:hypothetical protein
MPSEAELNASVKLLASKFRADAAARPILLLGAGASVSSGVPLAADLVRRIGRYGHAIHRLGNANAFPTVPETDGQNFLRQFDWFRPDAMADCFPAAVEHVLRPAHVRKQFFDHNTRHSTISEGYHALTRLVMRGLCCTILTTNFDDLLPESFRLQRSIRDIVEINKTRGDLCRFSSHNRCQIVFLHGRSDYYTDCNLADEVQRLNEALAHRLWGMLAEAPLIVIGYGGGEPSIMQHLLGEGAQHTGNFRHGIYWCAREPHRYHPSVDRLEETLKGNFNRVAIGDFDSLMIALDRELAADRVFLESTLSAPEASWDSLPVAEMHIDDIDSAQAVSTLTRYYEVLRLPRFEPEQLHDALLDRGLAVRLNGKLIPTNACVLLFGKYPQRVCPQAIVSFTTRRKALITFRGNLVTQLRDIRQALNSPEVNPRLRIKNQDGLVEKSAYAPRAVSELIANLIAHRDYSVAESATIDHEPGRSLSFKNPGGLIGEAAERIHVDPGGRFDPVRGASAARNRIIADILCGVEEIQKLGSGLADVAALSEEHGGRAEFAITNGTRCEEFSAILQQAKQSGETASVATRRNESELFTTNLLPFRHLPEEVYRIPVRDPWARKISYEPNEWENLPACIIAGGYLLSFTSFEQTPAFAQRNGILEMQDDVPVAELLTDALRRRDLVWLLGAHWRRHLDQFEAEGLVILPREKRAYFGLGKSRRLVIHYKTATGRSSRREVVKVRGEKEDQHENEGFYYQVVCMGGELAVQIKPMYVFTGADGVTPLPPRYQTAKATRRFRFDRNKMVGDDLMFWSRYLGKESESVNLGGGWRDDLILDMRFLAVELPAPKEIDPA